jgi:hypothetical protein
MLEGAREIDWQYVDGLAANDVQVGELVSAAAGGLPIYRITALEGETAHLTEEHDGSDRVAPLSDFHWKACAG